MTDQPAAPHVRICPRCGAQSHAAAWCPKCGLNLRTHTPTQLSTPPSIPGGQPRTPLWDGVPRRPSPMQLAGISVLVAVAAVIIAVVVATGSNSVTHTVPVVSTVAASSTPTASAPLVESSAVQQVLSEYQTDYSNESAAGLKSLFSSSLVRQDGAHAPESRGQALGTYRHQLSELTNPSYTLSGGGTEPGAGEATATGRYSITSQYGTVGGSIPFHLIHQGERLLIDKLTIEPSK